MKNLILVATFGVMAMAVGCSHQEVKEARKPDSTIIDGGMFATAPVKVNENHVYDAGVFREKEDYSDLATHGGQNGRVIPTEHFYSIDREKWAPSGKLLYVLTEDQPAHCILGKYVTVEGHKQLVVYSKSTVPSNYCIYQKTYSSEAEGFSIFVKDGGICRPSYTAVNTDDQKRRIASVQNVDNNVSMSYCVDNTISYGTEFSKRHQ